MAEIFQVDAFANELFGGNPAAVLPLPHWANDEMLQNIAAENNLAETAFIVRSGTQWEIRWFTPTSEVALCGHATLAAAHVVFEHLNWTVPSVDFKTSEAGVLSVKKLSDGLLSMSFPTVSLVPVADSYAIEQALGKKASSLWRGHYSENQYDVVAVFETAKDIASLDPDFATFKTLDSRGVIATAKGDECDFVSRYFAPNFGIPEDPVTGSAHCLTAPYWAKMLDKTELTAIQLSKRRDWADH